MSKKLCFFMISFLFGSFLGSIVFVGAYSVSSVSPISTVAVLYGVSNLPEAVSDYDVLLCDFNENYAGGFSLHESLNAELVDNPSLKVYGYMNPLFITTARAYYSEVNAHESWFAHDEDGYRIYDSIWNQYLMNVTVVEYQEWFVDWCNDKVNDVEVSRDFDGVLFDNVNCALTYAINTSEYVPASYRVGFYSHMLGFLENVAPSVDGDVIINSEDGWEWGYLGFDYLDAVEGQWIEGIGHRAYTGDYNSEWCNSKILDVMDYARSNDKLIFAVGGDDSFVVGSDENWFCYSLYCLGAFGGSYFGVQAPDAYYDELFYDSLLVTDLGLSFDEYYGSSYVFARDYSLAVVNVDLVACTYFVDFLFNTAIPTSVPVDGLVGNVLNGGLDWVSGVLSNAGVVAGLFVVGFCFVFFKKVRESVSGD